MVSDMVMLNPKPWCIYKFLINFNEKRRPIQKNAVICKEVLDSYLQGVGYQEGSKTGVLPFMVIYCAALSKLHR